MVRPTPYPYDLGQWAVKTQSVARHPAGTLTHSQDADGLRTGLVYTGGQLASMTFQDQPMATTTYRRTASPSAPCMATARNAPRGYDAHGLLTGAGAVIEGRFFTYDCNGNVTTLTSPTGTVQATNTCGAFHETPSAIGPLAASNPWRFSTKYPDTETGLL